MHLKILKINCYLPFSILLVQKIKSYTCRYTLIELQFHGNPSKHAGVIAISKSEKKEEKHELEEIRQTLKTHISGTAWQIQPKFGPPPQRNPQKNCVLLFSECQATDAENSIFFTPVKYTHLVYHALQVSLEPHDTLSCVLISSCIKVRCSRNQTV